MKSVYVKINKVNEIISICRKGNFSFFRILVLLICKTYKVYELENYINSFKNQVTISDHSNLEDNYDNILEKENSNLETNKSKENYKEFKVDKRRFIWFVPNWSNVWGGGHYTLFRFANYFANQHMVQNIIFIYNYNDTQDKSIKEIEQELFNALPNCQLKVETSFDNLLSCDAAIATTWQSAYFVKRFKFAFRKFYFMQDYESLFYPAGSLSMQANHTYTFGFYGITGGTWLKEIFESYKGEATNYIFGTDKNIFYPKIKDKLSKVRRIFFYGRPSTERRAYELGISSLKEIAKNYPDIEIVIAGLDKIDKPKFNCILLGNLSLKETGELYRTCDIGIALSATNLSYLPVELMASGCPVITNGGPQVEWYCKNEYNCLTTNPTVFDIVRCVDKLVNSVDLRNTLINNGLKTTESTTWEKEMEKIYQYIDNKIFN